jgi:hypothetical protein
MHGLSRRHLIFLPLLACACQSRRVAPLELSGAGSLPTYSWVVLVGGARVPVDRGMITRDSIVGFQGTGERFAVSRDSVASVEERRPRATSPSVMGPLKVLGVIAVAALAATTLGLLLVLNELD